MLEPSPAPYLPGPASAGRFRSAAAAKGSNSAPAMGWSISFQAPTPPAVSPAAAPPPHQSRGRGVRSRRARKEGLRSREGSARPGNGLLGRQQPGPAPNLQVCTHLRIRPAAMRSLAARDTHVLVNRSCARPPGPCFLDPLCLLSPDPRLRFVELREGRAEDAD